MSETKIPDPGPDDSEPAETLGGNDEPPAEIGGPRGKEPTRYGDWEKNGRCIDF